MLSIRMAQQAVFDAMAGERFEQGLVVHAQKVYSAQCLKLGEAGTREFVRRSVTLAREQGIVLTGGVVTFVELLFEYGEHFDLSPDGPAAVKILNDSGLPGEIKVVLLTECLTARTGGRRIMTE